MGMKKLLLNSLTVLLFFSYCLPVEAMQGGGGEQQQQNNQGWLNWGWQAAKQGAFSAKQKVAGLIESGRQRALLTHQKVSNALPDVRNWSWSRAVAMLTAIALTFGIVISVYNRDGAEVETFGDKSFFATIAVPLVGFGAKYFYSDFNQSTALLINRSNELTKDPQVAIDGLKREYEVDIKGTAKDGVVTKASYDAAINYFEEIIRLQKNMLLAEAQKESAKPEVQEKKLRSSDFKSKILSGVADRNAQQATVEARSIIEKQAIVEARSIIEKQEKEEKEVDRIVELVKNKFPNNVKDQLDLLKRVDNKKSMPTDFPVDRSRSVGAITNAIARILQQEEDLKELM